MPEYGVVVESVGRGGDVVRVDEVRVPGVPEVDETICVPVTVGNVWSALQILDPSVQSASVSVSLIPSQFSNVADQYDAGVKIVLSSVPVVSHPTISARSVLSPYHIQSWIIATRCLNTHFCKLTCMSLLAKRLCSL